VDGDWTVARAKAHLSEVMNRAMSEGPQTITRNGRKAVVVVSAQEWEKKTKRKGSLVEFFANSPLRDVDLDLERSRDGFRPIDL
jgi:prevent-host-death family protein